MSYLVRSKYHWKACTWKVTNLNLKSFSIRRVPPGPLTFSRNVGKVPAHMHSHVPWRKWSQVLSNWFGSEMLSHMSMAAHTCLHTHDCTMCLHAPLVNSASHPTPIRRHLNSWLPIKKMSSAVQYVWSCPRNTFSKYLLSTFRGRAWPRTSTRPCVVRIGLKSASDACMCVQHVFDCISYLLHTPAYIPSRSSHVSSSGCTLKTSSCKAWWCNNLVHRTTPTTSGGQTNINNVNTLPCCWNTDTPRSKSPSLARVEFWLCICLDPSRYHFACLHLWHYLTTIHASTRLPGSVHIDWIL